MSRPASLIAVALTTLLAGCGGAEKAVREPDGTVALTLVDFRIRPQVVRAPRDSLTIRVVNEGRLAHALRIRGRSEDRTLLKVPTLLPGSARARVGVRLPRGRWRLFCPLSNHEELGMHGTLVIR